MGCVEVRVRADCIDIPPDVLPLVMEFAISAFDWYSTLILVLLMLHAPVFMLCEENVAREPTIT